MVARPSGQRQNLGLLDAIRGPRGKASLCSIRNSVEEEEEHNTNKTTLGCWQAVGWLVFGIVAFGLKSESLFRCGVLSFRLVGVLWLSEGKHSNNFNYVNMLRAFTR